MIEFSEWMLPLSVEVGDSIRLKVGVCKVTAVGETPTHTLFICTDVYDIEHVWEQRDDKEIEVVFMVEEAI